jgi:hypothetical protein
MNRISVGKAIVSDWINDYNKKHRFKAGTISLQKESMYQFTLLLTQRNDLQNRDEDSVSYGKR